MSRHEDEEKKVETQDGQKDEIDDLMLLEDRNKGNLSFSIIKNYIHFNGGIVFLLIMTFFLIVWTMAYLGQTIWMAQWTKESSEHPDTIDNLFYLEIYTSLSLTYGLFVFFRSWYLVITSCSSATKIHNKMVK